ncbi:tautomerase family protein [Salinigranum marinum]|uniref:tautomerase family protein n=1 Tax=Salinigranum marinum TaxID=1515595 RepID=UPI002989B0EE|nr:tautomerase family protein [Salinigranum marinum]
MPHLRFETTATPHDRRAFTEWVTERFAEIMETGTSHVGVSLRIRDGRDLALGRAGPDEDVALVDADVRAGRTDEQRRELAVSIVERLADRWGLPEENVYLVYTEHDGRDFHLVEGALASWDETEADTGATRREE